MSAKQFFIITVMPKWAKIRSSEPCSTGSRIFIDYVSSLFLSLTAWGVLNQNVDGKSQERLTGLLSVLSRSLMRLVFIPILYVVGSFGTSVETHFPQALGEAEAELAYLNKLGFIDAVLTSDSDALVFGAVTVLKR